MPHRHAFHWLVCAGKEKGPLSSDRQLQAVCRSGIGAGVETARARGKVRKEMACTNGRVKVGAG